jgi:hypothetical protein
MKPTTTYSRSQRYSIVNDVMKGLAYRNRRDEPVIPGDSRMLADELNRFEACCHDLEERIQLAAVGSWRKLAEAILEFREAQQP